LPGQYIQDCMFRIMFHVHNHPYDIAIRPSSTDLAVMTQEKLGNMMLLALANSENASAVIYADDLIIGPMGMYSRRCDEVAHPEAARIFTDYMFDDTTNYKLGELHAPLAMFLNKHGVVSSKTYKGINSYDIEQYC